MSTPNIVFYSKKCVTCYKLIQELHEHNFMKYFKLLCVDGKCDALPPQIKSVPTMIISNINKPLGPEESFQWIKTMKSLRDKMSQKNTNIEGFMDLEFNKFSDSFALLNSDDPLSQSFFKYKDEQNNVIHTEPLNAKLNQKEQTAKINELSKNRHEQESQFKVDIKKIIDEKLQKLNK